MKVSEQTIQLRLHPDEADDRQGSSPTPARKEALESRRIVVLSPRQGKVAVQYRIALRESRGNDSAAATKLPPHRRPNGNYRRRRTHGPVCRLATCFNGRPVNFTRPRC